MALQKQYVRWVEDVLIYTSCIQQVHLMMLRVYETYTVGVCSRCRPPLLLVLLLLLRPSHLPLPCRVNKVSELARTVSQQAVSRASTLKGELSAAQDQARRSRRRAAAAEAKAAAVTAENLKLKQQMALLEQVCFSFWVTQGLLAKSSELRRSAGHKVVVLGRLCLVVPPFPHPRAAAAEANAAAVTAENLKLKQQMALLEQVGLSHAMLQQLCWLSHVLLQVGVL